MAACYCYCLGIKSNDFFLKDNKKAFILWLNVPKVTAYYYLCNRFKIHIKWILTRIFCGEEVDALFLPCDYVRHFEDGMDAEVTKTSQAVA